MSIRDEWIVLDTNIWIFGLRRTPEFLACADLLQNLNRLQIVLPRQILQELQTNLVEDELRELFRFLNRLAIRPKIDWQKATTETVAKYQRMACKLGDAVVSAHLEELKIKTLVTENLPDKHRVGPEQCIDSARKDCKIALAQALSSAFLKVKRWRYARSAVPRQPFLSARSRGGRHIYHCGKLT